MGFLKYIFLSVLAVLAFIPLMPYFRSCDTTEMKPCIFCDIVAGKLATKIEYETDEFIIFGDIKPASTHHYLAVPKHHYESLRTLTSEQDVLLERMETGLKQFFESRGIDTKDALFGFHLPPFISVHHLHMHGISPSSSIGFFNRIVFRPGSGWFKSVDDAHTYVKQRNTAAST